MAKLKFKRKVDNRDVYDISVVGEHEFYANNILVHNCGK